MKGEEGRCYIPWDGERYMIYPLNFKSKGKGYIPLDGGDIGDNPGYPMIWAYRRNAHINEG